MTFSSTMESNNIPKQQRALKKSSSFSPHVIREKAIQKFLSSSEESRKKFLSKFRDMHPEKKCNLLREFVVDDKDDDPTRTFGVKSIEETLDWSTLVESDELEEAVIEIENAIELMRSSSWDEYIHDHDPDENAIELLFEEEEYLEEDDDVICPVCRQHTMSHDSISHILICECGVGISLQRSYESPHCSPFPSYVEIPNHHDDCPAILSISRFKQLLSDVFNRHLNYCLQIQQHVHGGGEGPFIRQNPWENHLQFQINETGQQLIGICSECSYYERIL